MYEKIQQLCDNKGIKPAQLCKEIGISKSTLSELKNERTESLSAKSLKKIATFFGVTLDYFYTDTVEDIKDELFEKRRLLYDISEKATPAQLDDFITMLEALVNNDNN